MLHSSPDFFNKFDVYTPVYDSFYPKDFEKMALCIKENRYYQNGLCLEKIGEIDGHDITSMRLSKERRAIAISMGRTIVLVSHLEKHDYPSQEQLKQHCRIAKQHYLDHFEKYFQNIPLTQDHKIIHKDRAIPVQQLTLRYNQAQIILDQEQSEICYTNLPAKVQGGPGAGKSLVGLFMLQDQDEGTIGYYAKSSFLVEKQRLSLQEQQISSEKAQSVLFFSFSDLYPAERTHFKKELVKWVESTKKSQFPILMGINSSYLIQELQTLYILERLFPDRFSSLYSSNFVRSSFYDRDQIAAITSLFDLFKDRFFSHADKPFVEGFLCNDPIPDRLLSKCIIDENQDCTVAENFFFIQKTENAQILFLRDTKQSQEWQGIDPLTLCESIWHTWLTQEHKKPIRIESLSLSKSYRNAPAVTKLANRMLRLLNLWIEGTVHKNESPLLETREEAGGQVRVYSSLDSPEYLSIQHHLPENSTQWAVITQPEFKEEARALFGPYTLVFTPKEVTGLEFCCIVRYKATNRAVLARQEDSLLKRLLKNPDLPLFFNKSRSIERHAELIQSIGADVTCTTRARELVLVIEPDVNPQDFDSKKKVRIVQDALAYLYPRDQYGHHEDPWIVNMTASSFEEWSTFIQQLYENNLETEAEHLFQMHLQPHTGFTFIHWIESLLLKKEAKIKPEPEVDAEPKHLTVALENASAQTASPEKPIIKKNSKTSSPSHKKYKNIKHVLTSINLNGQLVNIESESDLADLLFDNLVLLNSGNKNPIQHVTRPHQPEAVSLCIGLAIGSEKVRSFIKSKIEKILNIGSMRKKVYSIAFFSQPCPEDFKTFLQERLGVKDDCPNLGSGLFWLIIHYSEACVLLELFLLVKNRNALLLPNDAKASLSFLYQDWRDHRAEFITEEVLNSEGYEHIEQFFSNHMRKKLELKIAMDRNPEAMVYNIIFSAQESASATSPHASYLIVPILLNAVAAMNDEERYQYYLGYRSPKSSLNALELAISYRNKHIIIFLLKEIRALYSKGIPVPKNALSLLWQDLYFYLDDIGSFQEIFLHAIETWLWPTPQLCRIDLLFRITLSLDISSISPMLTRFLQYCHTLETKTDTQECILIPARYENIYFKKSILELLLNKNFFELATNLLAEGLDPLPLSVVIDANSLSRNSHTIYSPLIKTPKILMHIWENLVNTITKNPVPITLVRFILEKSHDKFDDFKEGLTAFLFILRLIDGLLCGDTPERVHRKQAYIADLTRAILNYGLLKMTDRISCSQEYGLSLLHNSMLSYSMNEFFAMSRIDSPDNPEKIHYDFCLLCFLLDSKNTAVIQYALEYIKNILMSEHNDDEKAFIIEKLCISLEPQSRNQGRETLLSIAIKNNNSTLALLLIEAGIDIISHRGLSRAPIIEMIDQLNHRANSLNDLPEKQRWRLAIKAIIPRLYAINKRYDFMKYNARESEYDSVSYFIDLILAQEFDVAKDLLTWEIIDIEPIIQNEKSKLLLEKHVFCVSKENMTSSTTLLLQSFILRVVSDSILLDKMTPIFLNALEMAIHGQNIAYINTYLEEMPQLVLGAVLIDPHYHYDQNGTLLGHAFKDCHLKDPEILTEIVLKICDALVSIQATPEVIERYINAPIDQKTGDIRETALFFALHCELFTAANRLISMGGELLSPYGHLSIFLQALHVAAPTATLKTIVKEIADHHDLNRIFSHEDTLESSFSYNPEILKLFRDIKCPISYGDIIILSQEKDVVQYFFELGGQIPYEHRYQILSLIIRLNDPELLEIVLNHWKGCSDPKNWIYQSDSRHKTLLDIAVSLHLRTAAMLIEKTDKNKRIILLLIEEGCFISSFTKRIIKYFSDETIREALMLLPELESREAPLLFSKSQDDGKNVSAVVFAETTPTEEKTSDSKNANSSRKPS